MRDRNLLEFAYLLALAAIATTLTLILHPGEPTGPDIDSYVPIANAIIDDPRYFFSADAYQNNFWSMGYPTLLAGMLFLTGSLTGVTIIQAFLVGTLVFIPWLLTRHIPGPTRLIAPAILAVMPAIWGIGTSIAYEAPYAALLGFSLAIAWNLRTNPPRSLWATRFLATLSGFLISLGVLMQTKTLIVVPVVIFLLWKAGRSQFGLGVLGFLIAVLPWSLRNALVLGSPSPLAGNGPFNIWVGNNPATATGGAMLEPPAVPAGLTPLQAALEFVVSQPERAFELIILKSARLTQPLFVYPELLAPGPGRTLLHALVAVLNAFIVLGVVAFVGTRIVAGPKGVPPLTAPAVFVTLFFVVHLPFIAEPRYMAPVLPVSAAIAVATSVWALKRVSARRLTKR
jgi:hypothetical protein